MLWGISYGLPTVGSVYCFSSEFFFFFHLLCYLKTRSSTMLVESFYHQCLCGNSYYDSEYLIRKATEANQEARESNSKEFDWVVWCRIFVYILRFLFTIEVLPVFCYSFLCFYRLWSFMGSFSLTCLITTGQPWHGLCVLLTIVGPAFFCPLLSDIITMKRRCNSLVISLG